MLPYPQPTDKALKYVLQRFSFKGLKGSPQRLLISQLSQQHLIIKCISNNTITIIYIQIKVRHQESLKYEKVCAYVHFRDDWGHNFYWILKGVCDLKSGKDHSAKHHMLHLMSKFQFFMKVSFIVYTLHSQSGDICPQGGKINS